MTTNAEAVERVRRELDLSLLVAAAMMISFGVTMVYSAASGSDVWRNQALYAVIALFVAVAILYVPDKLFYDLAYPLYGLGLLSLLAVLVWGTGNPARWLALGSIRMQPSEFTKVAAIMAVARFLGDQSSERVGPRAIGTAVLLAALPMGLVARQPDLGTAVSFGAALIPMLYWLRSTNIRSLASPRVGKCGVKTTGRPNRVNLLSFSEKTLTQAPAVPIAMVSPVNSCGKVVSFASHTPFLLPPAYI